MAIPTRRTVLAAGGGLVGLGLLGFGGSLIACNRESLLAALPLERLDVALAHIRAPERIGRAYLAQEGRAAVETAFLERRDLVAALRLDCPETRAGRIRAEMRADFASGDVVVADRWVVSRTECVIAALRLA